MEIEIFVHGSMCVLLIQDHCLVSAVQMGRVQTEKLCK